jgi:hypothetical protein
MIYPKEFLIMFVRQVLRELSMETAWIDANFCNARQLKRLYRKMGLSDGFSCIVLEHFDIFQDGTVNHPSSNDTDPIIIICPILIFLISNLKRMKWIPSIVYIIFFTNVWWI